MKDSFEPDEVELMSRAVDIAWSHAIAGRLPVATETDMRTLLDTIALLVLDEARSGATSEEALARPALDYLFDQSRN